MREEGKEREGGRAERRERIEGCKNSASEYYVSICSPPFLSKNRTEKENTIPSLCLYTLVV